VTEENGQEVLWGVPELAAPLPNARRTEAGLHAALRAAQEGGQLLEIDAGLVGGALVAARAMDRAEALPDKTAVYAIAQLLPAYQKALHGLGLPVERAPAGEGRLPDPTPAGPSQQDWLSDGLGPS
jgi:hypothetical protein